MRRPGTRCAGIAIGVLAAISIASAPAGAAPVVSQQKASVVFTPDPTGVGANPRPVALALRAWFDDVSADVGPGNQFATVTSTLFLQRDLVINLADFPGCIATVVFQDDRLCPAGSEIGSGVARIVGLGLDETLAIRAFNNGTSGFTVLVIGESPLIIREVVPVALTTQPDPVFPFRLSFPWPRNLQSPAPGVINAFQELSLTLPVQYAAINGRTLERDGNRIPYIANSGCTGFKYTADFTTSFDGAVNGGTQTVEAQAPCQGPLSGPVVPPRQGVDTTTGVVTGKVLVRLPGSGRTVVLTPGASVPIGAAVNAVAGSVQLFGQVGPAATDVVSGTFSRGAFTVRQARGARDLDAVLTRARTCPKGRRAKASRVAREPTNTVRVRERRIRRGGFRTIGGYSSASAIGTDWVTVDRCGSTTTRVIEGRVRVRDLVLRRNVLVGAGRRYTARAR